jgi:hypothetical protein
MPVEPRIVSSSVAMAWLSRRSSNPPGRNTGAVERYAALMLTGKWRIDRADPRDPIFLRLIHGERVLEDGAARLSALFEAQTVAEFYIDAPADLVIPAPRGTFLFAVSPSRAQTWLGTLRPSRVKALNYAAEMSAGRWEPVRDDPIVIDAGGQCVEGQHRLLAVVTRIDDCVPLWVRWL